MDIKVYHCTNSEENPTPLWLKPGRPKAEMKPEDLVKKFKRNPDAFFPPVIPPAKPKHR